MRETLGSELPVQFRNAAQQAVTEDMREFAEEVGDDCLVERLAGGDRDVGAGRTAGRATARRAP